MVNELDTKAIVEAILARDKRQLARSISMVENESPGLEALLEQLFSYTGKAYRLGITGPPGAGKSTLTARITHEFRKEGKRVGIIAVDPTSPFTGGAVLGDRIRMMEFATDEGVFIRSMASRGSLGGLARRAQEVADILDAAGYEIIIFETVGVGQTELDIAEAADTTVVVLVPESGDAIQTMKAGLMEIADIFVINKSDRAGADKLQLELEMMLHYRPAKKGDWNIPILQTSALEGKGVDKLVKSIWEHKAMLEKTHQIETIRLKRIREKVNELVRQKLWENFWTRERQQLLEKSLEQITQNKLSPYTLARQLMELAAQKDTNRFKRKK